jgi:hypothetical protein
MRGGQAKEAAWFCDNGNNDDDDSKTLSAPPTTWPILWLHVLLFVDMCRARLARWQEPQNKKGVR